MSLATALFSAAVLVQFSARAPSANLPPLTTKDVAVHMAASQTTPPFDPGESRAPVEGSADVKCRIGQDLKLEACVMVSEAPAGRSIGGYAVQLFSRMEVGATTRDGSVTAGRMIVLRCTVKSTP